MKKNLLLIISIALFLAVPLAGQITEMYISDAGNFDNPPWQILKFDENGANVDTFTNEELGWPQDIIFLEDQNVAIVSNLNTGRITKYDANSGAYLSDFATGISGPTRMKIGADSLLYVLQWQGSGTVLRYELDGTFVDEFTTVGVTQSIGIDWDADGNLYVSSYNGGIVRKFDPQGSDLGLFISSGLQGPTNVWFNDDGELLVLNWNGTTAKRYAADGTFIDNFITGLQNPEGIASLPNGNLLIGNGGTSAVKLFAADGTFIEDIVASGTGGLLLPNAVVLRTVTPPVAVHQVAVETKFIQPTIGAHFFLDRLVASRMEWIKIYDVSGMLVQQRKSIDHRVWNAQNFANGLYLITGQTTDGTLYTQKVIVQK